MSKSAKPSLIDTLRDKANPFGSSRVDNPFQDHADLKEIYQDEFEILKSIITDIKHDKNHQSKGAVVIGEPGSGKTHLMMRLAKELLKINRLLFIRQPNNPDSVLYHTYSRILESFIKKVSGSHYTQLEYLLANSFVKLISTTRIMILNKKDHEILAAVKNNNLRLYEVLGAEGSEKKRIFWQHIEKRTNEWWANEYGVAGYSAQIIKGIVKYCSYSDPRRKELVTRWLSANELTQDEVDLIGLNNWRDEMSREAFSLEAISVFSKLSLLDEPLIVVFDQLEGLGYKHNETLLINFGEAVKEIFTHVPNSLIILNLFPERWEQFKEFFDPSIVDRVSQYQVRLQKPSNEKLKEILELKLKETLELNSGGFAVNIESLYNPTELEIILNQKSIRAVLNSASDYYRYKVNNIPLPKRYDLQQEEKNSETVQQRLQWLENELNKLQNVAFSKRQEESKANDTLQRLQNIENSFNKLQDIISNFGNDLKRLYLQNDELKEEINQLKKSCKLEPTLIIKYLQEQKGLLEQEDKNPKIIADSDDIGKLKTIATAFESIKYFEINNLRLGNRKLPEHILVENENQRVAIGFLQVSGGSFTARIQNWNELVLKHKEHKDMSFKLFRDRSQPEITGKVAKEEIKKLESAGNGKFVIMEKEDRINFELIYKLITDIQNRDVEFELEEALLDLIGYLDNYWLINLFDEF